MMSEDLVVEGSKDGAIVRVRVKPRAGRDAVLGISGGALRVSVRAAPERGKATEATLRTLAAWLGIPAARVALASGAASRDKRVLVRSLTPSDLRKRVADRLGELPL